MGRDEDRKTDRKQETKVECPKCHLFLLKRSLDRHLAVKHGPRLHYWCQRCSHKNNRKDNLRAHYRECHPDKVHEVDRIEGETYESRECSRREDRREDNARKGGEKAPRSPTRNSRKSRSSPYKRESSAHKLSKLQRAEPSKKHGREEAKVEESTKKRGRDVKADEPAKKRGREESKEEKPATKAHKTTPVATVSRAPEDEPVDLSTTVREGTPRQGELSEAAATPSECPSTPKLIIDVPKAVKEVEVEADAQDIEGPLGEVAEIALSPTPMSAWLGEEDTPSGDVPTSTPSGKLLSMMEMLRGEAWGGADDGINTESDGGRRHKTSRYPSTCLYPATANPP